MLNNFKNPLTQMIDGITSKRSLKASQPILDNYCKSTGLKGEAHLFAHLIDSIDWGDLFQSKIPKDSNRLSVFVKRLKALVGTNNFLEFMEVVMHNVKKIKPFYETFVEFLKFLKLPTSNEILLIFSLWKFDRKIFPDLLSMIFERLKAIKSQRIQLILPLNIISNIMESIFVQSNITVEEKELFRDVVILQSKDISLRALYEFLIEESKSASNDIGKDIATIDISKSIKNSYGLPQLIIQMSNGYQNSTEIFQMVFSEYSIFSEFEILQAIIYMAYSNCKASFYVSGGQPIPVSGFAKTGFENLKTVIGGEDVAFTQQKNLNWSAIWFVNTINKLSTVKINWITVIEHLSDFDSQDSPLQFEIASVFPLLYDFIGQVASTAKVTLRQSFLNANWVDSYFRDEFLLFLMKEKSTSYFVCLLDSEKRIKLDHASGTVIGQLHELGPFLTNHEILFRIFSNKGNSLEGCKILEERSKSLFLGVLFILFQQENIMSMSLYQKLLLNLFSDLLDHRLERQDILHSLNKINSKLLVDIISKCYHKENNLILLVKIVEIAQFDQEVFLQLTSSNNHSFSIPLSLLSIKREYLKLESWIDERISSSCNDFISKLLDHMDINLVYPLTLSQQANKESTVDIFEKSFLSIQTIITIFELFLLSENVMSRIDDDIANRIEQVWKSLKGLIPDIGQLSVSDTEKRANELLEKLYYGQTTIELFMEQIHKFKNSSANRDQEILSCIIINIIDEFRFYHSFPERELNITSQIFGEFILNKIVDGRALNIFLKALTSSLEKEGRMLNFAIKSINRFATSDLLALPDSFYTSIFEMKKLYQNHQEFLKPIMSFLEKKNLANLISSEFLDFINVKNNQETRRIILPTSEVVPENEKVKEVENPNREETEEVRETLKNHSSPLKLPKSMAALPKKKDPLVTTTLFDDLNQIFEKLLQEETLSQQARDKTNFWLNGVNDKNIENKLEEIEYFFRDTGCLTFFSKVLVYQRVPTEPNYQNAYRKLIYRGNVPKLFKIVSQYSLQMINQVMDFISRKENLLPEEKNTTRYCGKWLGMITLVCNKPILIRQLDIRTKIANVLDTKTINNLIPLVTSLLSMISKSSLFAIRVPFIQAHLDLLKEIYEMESVSQTTKILIEVLFNELKFKISDVYPFDYIRKSINKNNLGEKFVINFSVDQVVLSPLSVDQESFLKSLHVDLKIIVSQAIDSAIKCIIKAVLDRSVRNTLETTRELVVKDLFFERDPVMFENCAKNMIINLTWNLALVTCREPLRLEIAESLDSLLGIQSDSDEQTRKSVRDCLTTLNIDFACSLIKKIVIDNSAEEIAKDYVIISEIENRRSEAKNKDYKSIDQTLQNVVNKLPALYRKVPFTPLIKSIDFYQKLSTFKIEKEFTELNSKTGASDNSNEELKISELLMTFEKDIEHTPAEKLSSVLHTFYSQLTRTLQNCLQVDILVTSLSTNILQKLFFQIMSHEKQIAFSDVLVIYSNYNRKLSETIIEWVFGQEDAHCFQASLLIIFLRRSLIPLKNFDVLASKRLSEGVNVIINCITIILKLLVVEERIFSIYIFPNIVKQLMTFNSKPEILSLISFENKIFIGCLEKLMRNNFKNFDISFRLSNIEPEYQRLIADINENYTTINQKIFKEVEKLTKLILNSNHINIDDSSVSDINEYFKNEKTITLYLSYLIEGVFLYSIQNLVNGIPFDADFIINTKSIDNLINFIFAMIIRSNDFVLRLEKVLTSMIVVIAKMYFSSSDSSVIQACTFRFLFSLMSKINNSPDYKQSLLPLMLQTLHILQPIKFPGLSFGWLQLISSPVLVTSLLMDSTKEHWSNYTVLIIDAMLFIKEYAYEHNPECPKFQNFYKGFLRLLLILIHDYSDFLCEQSYQLLEEIPREYIQFRNIILSAYPKNLKMINPFELSSQGLQNSNDYKIIPTISCRIESRINAHSLQLALINYIKNKSNVEFEAILCSFYISTSNGTMINDSLLDSFVAFVPFFIFSSYLTRSPEWIVFCGV